MLTTSIGGREELRKVQGLLVGMDRDLQQRTAKETRKAIAPIRVEIPAQARARMPSGYGPLLAGSTHVVTRVTAGATVKGSVKVTAQGKREQRDIRATDAGRLAHPLFGNRSKWYRQRVRPGWVSDPVEWTRKRVVSGAQKAANEAADQIVKG